MKHTSKLLAVMAVLCAGLLAVNATDKHIDGPKGGRLLEKTEPKAEFFLEKDRTVTITFYDNAMKPVAAAAQAITIVADAKEGKATIEFEKKGDVLVSKTKLPEGDGYNVVVQYRQTAESKPQNFRFKLDTHICGECKHAEYACACHD